MSDLNIIKLINQAEKIISDPQIGFAAEIIYPVQHVDIKGDVYELKLVLTLKE